LLQLLQNLLKKRLELFVHLQSPVSSSSEINRPRAAPPKHSVRGCNNLRPTFRRSARRDICFADPDEAVRIPVLRRSYRQIFWHWAARVSPTPLLMIVALADNITLTDLQLRALRSLSKQFPRASAAAVSWFRQHLVAGSHER